MSTKRLVIVYDGTEDKQLEEQLKEVMKDHGWEFYAAGVDLIEDERDLSFYKEDDE